MRIPFYEIDDNIYDIDTNTLVGSLDGSGKFTPVASGNVQECAVYNSLRQSERLGVTYSGAAKNAANRSGLVFPFDVLEPSITCSFSETTLVADTRATAISLASPVKWEWVQPANFILHEDEARNSIQSALDKVEAVCDLSFTEGDSGNRLIIQAGSATLGNLVPDLLTCPYCATIYLDDSLNWGYCGNFHNIFLHFLLHYLGLPHSDSEDDVMYADYAWNSGEKQLGAGDIAELEGKY